VFTVCGTAYTIFLAKDDPALLRRRTEVGVSHEREPAQKVIVLCLFVAFGALLVLPGLDVRFGWSGMPWYACDFGNAMVVVSFYIFYLVARVNTYAAANVRVEAGQTVISTGLYGFVRHPMYLGGLLFLAGTPLALGSCWALLLLPLFLAIIYFRIANEEEVLLRDLEGYAEYRQRVRYRLIPGVF
jgi:protein-S-isoprenylcysteine O-methyltransferase Ste14